MRACEILRSNKMARIEPVACVVRVNDIDQSHTIHVNMNVDERGWCVMNMASESKHGRQNEQSWIFRPMQTHTDDHVDASGSVGWLVLKQDASSVSDEAESVYVGVDSSTTHQLFTRSFKYSILRNATQSVRSIFEWQVHYNKINNQAMYLTHCASGQALSICTDTYHNEHHSCSYPVVCHPLPVLQDTKSENENANRWVCRNIDVTCRLLREDKAEERVLRSKSSSKPSEQSKQSKQSKQSTGHGPCASWSDEQARMDNRRPYFPCWNVEMSTGASIKQLVAHIDDSNTSNNDGVEDDVAWCGGKPWQPLSMNNFIDYQRKQAICFNTSKHSENAIAVQTNRNTQRSWKPSSALLRTHEPGILTFQSNEHDPNARMWMTGSYASVVKRVSFYSASKRFWIRPIMTMTRMDNKDTGNGSVMTMQLYDESSMAEQYHSQHDASWLLYPTGGSTFRLSILSPSGQVFVKWDGEQKQWQTCQHLVDATMWTYRTLQSDQLYEPVRTLRDDTDPGAIVIDTASHIRSKRQQHEPCWRWTIDDRTRTMTCVPVNGPEASSPDSVTSYLYQNQEFWLVTHQLHAETSSWFTSLQKSIVEHGEWISCHAYSSTVMWITVWFVLLVGFVCLLRLLEQRHEHTYEYEPPKIYRTWNTSRGLYSRSESNQNSSENLA